MLWGAKDHAGLEGVGGGGITSPYVSIQFKISNLYFSYFENKIKGKKTIARMAFLKRVKKKKMRVRIWLQEPLDFFWEQPGLACTGIKPRTLICSLALKAWIKGERYVYRNFNIVLMFDSLFNNINLIKSMIIIFHKGFLKRNFTVFVVEVSYFSFLFIFRIIIVERRVLCIL